MKNIIALFIVIIAFTSCEKDQEVITEAVAPLDLVAKVFSQKAVAIHDQEQKGLYRGIFSTYDRSFKGEILIDLGNSGNYEAAVKLIEGGDSFYFKGKEFDGVDGKQYLFENKRGSFEVNISRGDRIEIRHFNFDNKDAYIVAYKERFGVDVSISFGNFTDDTDPAFVGNWDAINKGATYLSPPAHSTVPNPLLIIEEIIISKSGNIFISSDGSPYNDSFIEPCFYLDTFQHGYFFETIAGTYKEIIGYNQTSTFAGIVCTWSLSHYLLGGALLYDTPACSTPAASGYGSWSWNGTSGKIFVDRLGTL